MTQMVYVVIALKLPDLEKRRILFASIEGHNCLELTDVVRR